MHAFASSLLPLRVYQKYVTLGFHTELVVVDRGKLENKPKEDAEDSLKPSATQTSWVDVHSEAECSALSFDAQDEECRSLLILPPSSKETQTPLSCIFFFCSKI